MPHRISRRSISRHPPSGSAESSTDIFSILDSIIGSKYQYDLGSNVSILFFIFIYLILLIFIHYIIEYPPREWSDSNRY